MSAARPARSTTAKENAARNDSRDPTTGNSTATHRILLQYSANSGAVNVKILQSLAAVALVAAAACGGGASNTVSGPTGGNPSGGNPSGGNPGTTEPVPTNAVAVGDNTFSPVNIVVSVGT